MRKLRARSTSRGSIRGTTGVVSKGTRAWALVVATSAALGATTTALPRHSHVAAEIRHQAGSAAPTARPNANTIPAGEVRDGVLRIALEARMATWHPDGDSLPGIEI